MRAGVTLPAVCFCFSVPRPAARGTSSCGAQNLPRLEHGQILTAAPSSPRFFRHRRRFGDDAPGEGSPDGTVPRTVPSPLLRFLQKRISHAAACDQRHRLWNPRFFVKNRVKLLYGLIFSCDQSLRTSLYNRIYSLADLPQLLSHSMARFTRIFQPSGLA